MYVYTHTHTQKGILFSHKKNESLTSGEKWMDLENNMVSKISQIQTDKYIWHYMWNLKNNTNKCIQQSEKHADIETKLVAARGEGKRGGAN